MHDLKRHDFIWLNDEGRSKLDHPYFRDITRQWADKDLPLIIRQQDKQRKENEISVGIALPPAQGKHRLSFNIAHHHIKTVQKPPLLPDLVGHAPHHWHGTITKLIKQIPNARVFGSLAWQYLTELDYVSPSSDLDLCLDITQEKSNLPAFLHILQDINHSSAMIIDCELTINGKGVHFKELLNGNNDDVLVKSLSGVTLKPAKLWLEEDYVA